MTPTAQENKENEEKQTKEQGNKDTETPLSWNEQVNNESNTLSDIMNIANIEQLEHTKNNLEAKNTHEKDEKCNNPTDKIKEDSFIDSEDFIDDAFMEGCTTATSSKEWNIRSLGTPTENEERDGPTHLDDRTTDSEPTGNYPESYEVAENSNDMQIDEHNIKPEEKISNAGASAPPQTLIMDSVDELSAAYSDEKSAVNLMTINEITRPNTSPDRNQPQALAGLPNGSRNMPHNVNLKIATLNVKGLNNRGKQTNTITLLKSYNLDIIALQETNMNNEKTIEQIKFQWGSPQYGQARVLSLREKKT
ncbi:23889_t:CDS:2 [Gigaspora rosea]|nr:23888_t:CDS:2 [Gigaspora rosea]CAG8558278.1 23889_t:CDS:2 [Gigaspora rosea]